MVKGEKYICQRVSLCLVSKYRIWKKVEGIFLKPNCISKLRNKTLDLKVHVKTKINDCTKHTPFIPSLIFRRHIIKKMSFKKWEEIRRKRERTSTMKRIEKLPCVFIVTFEARRQRNKVFTLFFPLLPVQ